MFTILTGYEGVHEKDGKYWYKKSSEFIFTKRITPTQKVPADLCGWFSVKQEIDPTSLAELYPYILEWSKDKHALAVRGGVIKGISRSTPIRRRTGVFEEKLSHIMVLDVDSLPLPEGIRKNDIAAQANYVCNILHKLDPVLFPDNLRYIAQGSSGSGFSNEIKLHLFLQNTCKISQAQNLFVFSEINALFMEYFNEKIRFIDTALYHPIQVHYMAEPALSGVKDPFSPTNPRIVMREGSFCRVPEDSPSHVFRDLKIEEKEFSFYSKWKGDVIVPASVFKIIHELENWGDRRGFRTRMIAAFHCALQENLDIKILEDLLRPVVNKARPGLSNSYFKDGRAAALKRFVQRSARVVPEVIHNIPLKTISSGNEKFLRLEESPPDGSMCFMKASLGSGKTTTIQDWIRRGIIPGTFLTITNTSALVEANAERLHAGDYRSHKDLLSFSAGKIKRLSGTIHSLWKLRDIIHKFEYVFIDECDAVLSDLLFASIIEDKKRFMIIETLRELLLNCKVVILSDGDISTETVEGYSSLIHYTKKLYRINHKVDTLAGVTAFQHTSLDSVFGALKESIVLGYKCLLVSDSGPDSLNELNMSLESCCPDRVIKVAHVASKEDQDIRDIFNFTNDALKSQKVDALLCSPTITNGIDFNYFESVFVLTNSTIHSPNLRYQALRRERQPQFIHFYFSRKLYKGGFCTGISKNYISDNWLDSTRAVYAKRRESEGRYYLNTFQYYLLSEGAEIDVVLDPFPGLPSSKEAYLEQRVTAILESTNSYKISRHNDAYEQKNLCMALYDVAETELTRDLIKDFLVSNLAEKCRVFYQLLDKFSDDLKVLSDSKCALYVAKDLMKRRGYEFWVTTGCEVPDKDWKIYLTLKSFGFYKDTEGCYEIMAKATTRYALFHSLEIPKALKTSNDSGEDL